MRDDNAIKVVTYLDGPVRQDTLIEDALRPHRAVASAAMAGLSRRIPADCPQTRRLQISQTQN